MKEVLEISRQESKTRGGDGFANDNLLREVLSCNLYKGNWGES